jgi:hypothetical protein
MQEKYGPEVRQDAVKSEQYIAYYGQNAQRDDRAHGEAAEHGERCRISHNVDPRHRDISAAVSATGQVR